jgi:anti-anti-sigma regulatory factor
MLRITTVRSGTTGTLKVEGRLAGEWVGELSKAAAAAEADAPHVVVDLAAVTFVDADGASLLRALRNRGVSLADCSVFVSGLIDGGSR